MQQVKSFQLAAKTPRKALATCSIPVMPWSTASAKDEEMEIKKDAITEERAFDSVKINSESSEINQLILEKEIDAANLIRAKEAINEHFEPISVTKICNIVTPSKISVKKTCEKIIDSLKLDISIKMT